jgi:hypothetical protein
MNANEIADGLAQMYIEKDVNGLFNKRIQNMLRQQQAEIEALKKALEPWVMYVDEFAQVPPETWQKLADCAKLNSEWKKK